MKKTINLSVTEFALPSPKRGSIDGYAGFGTDASLGSEIHRKVQADRAKEFTQYESEVSVSHQFTADQYNFKVNGRMDGIFYEDKVLIEEIKTSFNIRELERYLKANHHDHPYCLQLKTYGYIHWLKTKEIPQLYLLLVSSRNFTKINYPVEFILEDYEKWLACRLEELVKEVNLAEKINKRRRNAAKNFEFPFTTPRKGQIELVSTIDKSIAEKKPLLIQAPTGLGKTMGVMYPILKDALSRGQKSIYLTPKNSQHAVAEDAVDKLSEIGASVKSLTLTAKSKLCMKQETLCNAKYCEFAENHYTKIVEHDLKSLLAKKRHFKAKTFKELAETYQVCPFELQFEVVNQVDVVICDYNYVFAPRISVGRLATNNIGEEGKPNLIIDEAHNLPSRSMDYFSPSLSTVMFHHLLKESEKVPEKFREEAVQLLNECIAIIDQCAPLDTKQPCKINPPIRKFLKHDTKLREFLATYLSSDAEIVAEDPIMKFTYYWSEFTQSLEFIDLGRSEFFTTFHPFPATIKITCCDASDLIKTNYDDFQQVVGFSATLKPFDYYSKLMGLNSSKLNLAEFGSPFLAENRKIMVIPQISTKYNDRDRNYARIVEAINKITALKRGNYFVFFPSFEFLEKTLRIFIPNPGFNVLQQQRKMTKENVESILTQLKNENSAHIIFAVQGGIFSEGVDYPGNMAIGAFIIGPPLATFDLEQEKKREYYQQVYSSGFEYAYVYPAMAKAVQAAGRVIRSETDKGLIVLMDNRFLHPSYASCMPEDWGTDYQSLISTSILSDITEFWENKHS